LPSRSHEAAERQVFAHVAAELERHAVGAGELQVGQALARLCGQRRAARIARAVQLGEAAKAGAPPRLRFRRGAVGAEELLLAVGIAGDQPGQPPRHPGVAGERGMLGERQLQPPMRRGGAAAGSSSDRGGGKEGRRVHGVPCE
jgi:hypothetical protein